MSSWRNKPNEAERVALLMAGIEASALEFEFFAGGVVEGYFRQKKTRGNGNPAGQRNNGDGGEAPKHKVPDGDRARVVPLAIVPRRKYFGHEAGRTKDRLRR
jgi:hypothetical protein